jgi:arylsulfatase A-like enzyme
MRPTSTLLLAALCGPACAPTLEDRPFEPKNVLMISVDTVRRDHLARYGSTAGLTPFLDDLASRSLVLDRHSSCSNWTLAGVLCAADGRDTIDLGYVAKLSDSYREVVPDRPTLASWLREQGFYTLLITSNGWLEGDWHHDGGFAYAENLPTAEDARIWEYARNKLFEAQLSGEAQDDHWFVHIHLMEVHSPYTPPDAYLDGLDALDPIAWDLTTSYGHNLARDSLQAMEEDERALVLEHLELRYDGALAYEDDILAAIWADAQRRGLLRDTLVVLWTDHGEQQYEREHWGHAFELYQEEVGALAMFWHPGIEPRAWAEPTSHIDIAPTVLAWLDVPMPTEITGLPVGEAPYDRALIHDSVGRVGPLVQLSRGDLRMHYDYTQGTIEVYDTVADPGQTADLYDPFDPEHARLWELTDAYADELEPLLAEYSRAEPAR